mgnify:CR=1 FL=1
MSGRDALSGGTDALHGCTNAQGHQRADTVSFATVLFSPYDMEVIRGELFD